MLKFPKFAKELQLNQKKNLSAVAIKKIVKAVEGVGLAVKGVKANPDGSVFLETEKQSQDKGTSNYWDKVLTK